MSIKDIKFMNGEGYLLKDLPLTFSEYVVQMKTIDYDRFYDPYRICRDDMGVEKTQFPPVILAFYQVVFSNGRIPSPAELLSEYYHLNEGDLFVDGDSVTYNNHKFKKMDVDARILRTYPSLIRDHHFYLMLVDSKCFDKVIYSCKDDINGKDITIRHQRKEYVLSLFIKTRRSNFYKRVKNVFRHFYGVNEIQLPLDLDTAEKCGDFYVYGLKDLDHVKSIIHKKTRLTLW